MKNTKCSRINRGRTKRKRIVPSSNYNYDQLRLQVGKITNKSLSDLLQCTDRSSNISVRKAQNDDPQGVPYFLLSNLQFN